MIQALRASGTLFDESDIERPGLWLNMNDCFGYATADVEEVQHEDIPIVYALWRTLGWGGVVWWVSQRRKQEPLPAIAREIAERLQQG